MRSTAINVGISSISRGLFPRKRSNDVFINGNKISLGDSLFALLMRLAVELKKKKEGWVHSADLEAEGFIRDSTHPDFVTYDKKKLKTHHEQLLEQFF